MVHVIVDGTAGLLHSKKDMDLFYGSSQWRRLACVFWVRAPNILEFSP